MINIAKQVILVTDSSSSTGGLAFICGIDQIDVVVTDAASSPRTRNVCGMQDLIIAD
jgi:DeoR/GlpR family transcriptional regulator of sugar metabolism